MKKNNIRILFSVIAIVVVGIFLYFNVFDSKDNYSTTNYYLDTVNTVTLVNTRKKTADKVLPQVDKIILKVNNDMSAQLPGSEVSKINDNSGIKPVSVSEDTFDVVKKSIFYSKLTDGKFDITIGPITSLWNIGNDKARVPSEKEIKALLPLVNYRDIVLDESNHSVFLKKKGMKIDVGGIAKGFCADKVCSYLKSQGIEDAIINLGGNIYVLGKNADGKDFSVGIQNPQNTKQQDSMASIKLTDKSIVTSGIYERFLEKDGRIYHHMINPSTGYPFDNNLSSVTIVSDKSIDGDALSTSAFGMGIKDGMKMIESLKNVDAIFITKDDKVYITKGLKDNFVISDDRYRLAD